MQNKKIPFSVTAMDYVALEKPRIIYFGCNDVRPVGLQVLKEIASNGCIVGKSFYMVKYGGEVFGTDFKGYEDFQQYLNAMCSPMLLLDDDEIATMDDCIAT